MKLARIVAASAALLVAGLGVAAAQNVSLNPTYGTANLASGFQPDPYVVNVQSGGTINAQTLSPDCAGFIATAPDIRLNFTGGSLPLIISVASSADTTLVVNGADGQWYCDDDTGTNGLNPMVRFNNPRSGQYDIWVGTYGNATLQPAAVNISELYTQ
ncbi:MAG: peptidase S1 [Terricaulis sp.]